MFRYLGITAKTSEVDRLRIEELKSRLLTAGQAYRAERAEWQAKLRKIEATLSKRNRKITLLNKELRVARGSSDGEQEGCYG